MGSVFKKILCPVDLDGSAPSALHLAGDIARECGGEVHVLHVVRMVLPPAALQRYVNLDREDQEFAEMHVADLVSRNLGNVPSESETVLGDPAAQIIEVSKRLPADLVVMATHRRHGFPRLFLGSVAEIVMREVTCPVVTVKSCSSDQCVVAGWMTPRPTTIAPEQKVTEACTVMQEHHFRSLPVLREGKLVGIISDRDIRTNLNCLGSVEVSKAMTEKLVTVTPGTSIWDAARILQEKKIGALPVLEEGRLIGVVSTTDLLRAFTELQ